MRPVIALALGSVLLSLGFRLAAAAAAPPTTLFACTIGTKTIAVTSAGAQLTYHYGTANKTEKSIVGRPAAGNIFQMTQRFAGLEYQLRFTSGNFSYIVYSSEGNERVGASATSGLVVMHGTKLISDRTCAPYAELAMPAESLKIPEDTDAYSAL